MSRSNYQTKDDIVTTPPSSAPEPQNPNYSQQSPGEFPNQPGPGEPGGPTLDPAAPQAGAQGQPGALPAANTENAETAKPGMAILLGLLGAAIFGFTFLTWVGLNGLSEWASLFGASEREMERELGIEWVTSNGRDVEGLHGGLVGILGLGIVVVVGSMRSNVLPAIGGFIGSVLAAVAGVMTFMSYQTIAAQNQEIHDDMAAMGLDPDTLGLPALDYNVGIGLWLTLAACVLAIVVGVLVYTTRNRPNAGVPGITSSDGGATPAPGLY